MPLPILQTSSAHASPQDLIRFFLQTQRDWTRHLSEETVLDVGTAFHNTNLGNVWDANCVLDAASPEGMSPVDAVAQVNDHYAAQSARCRRWTMNPSAPAERTAPLVEHLIGSGFRTFSADVMHMAGAPSTKIAEVGGLKIIPSRASFRHARELAEESSKQWNEPQLVDAMMLHLEDPHFDSLIALKDGQPIATAGVLAVGEIGRIDEVFVAERFRRLGIGRTMMSRMLEICARSLFKQVLLSVLSDNAPAKALYEQVGFRHVGAIVAYAAPD
jgi:GNAT superfamily N-acetyltransferase